MMKILIVEDSALQRTLLTALLKVEGFTEVVSAENVARAFSLLGMLEAKVAPVEIDLVLLDLNLPDLSGLEVLRRIKAHPQRRNIPVVMLSASDDESDMKAAMRAGAFGYLVKPPKVETLARVLREVEKHRKKTSR